MDVKRLHDAAVEFGRADLELEEQDDLLYEGDPDPDLVDRHVNTYEVLKTICRELAKDRAEIQD